MCNAVTFGTRDRAGLPALLLLALFLGAFLAGPLAAASDPEAESGTPEARAHAYMAQDPPDWAAAREAFAEAAEAGSPTAMSHLGWIHEEGHGVQPDGERAAEWYGRAARAGAHDVAVKLGWMYLGGQGVERDREQAEYWFGRAVDAGHGPARIAWASVLIADAQGGRNPEAVFEARELLEAALEDGFVLASYFLARLFIEGIGAHPVEDGMAAHYTRIGADSGDPRMQGWLALMLTEGRGVEADRVQASKWANLAAANGDRLGEQLRVALEEELTPEEIREARERAVDWALGQR
ncbi:MAG: sel1 repeat family protein [Thioalkalivibrio sp.]|nr:MAG: sel1 repeat family protein [Thioalkalivibrio sp.]